jgi:hypothetical protein
MFSDAGRSIADVDQSDGGGQRHQGKFRSGLASRRGEGNDHPQRSTVEEDAT